MTITYLRDLPSESVSLRRTGVTPQLNGGEQALARTSWLVSLREWHRRRRSRTLLSELNERMLKDIGVTYAEAEHEANKPFWLP